MPGVIVPQMREKKDPLEALARGLQIATQVYGLKQASDQADEREAKRLEEQGEKMAALKTKQEQERGVITPLQALALQKDHVEAAPGTKGAITTFVRGADGKETPLTLVARGKDKPTGPKTEKVGDTLVQFDEATGEWKPVYSAPQKPVAPPKDITVAERNTLQLQYDRDLGTRKNRMVMEAFDDAQRLVQDPSPASDQALVFAYMKSLDPNSVVRESEAESAQALGGMMEKAKAWYQKQAGESGLTDKQRADLLAQIRKLADAAGKRQDGVDKQFTELAGRRQVDVKDLRFIGRPAFGDEKAPAETLTNAPKAAAGGGGASAPSVGNSLVPAGTGAPKVDPKIDEYAKQHKLDYMTAKSILEGRGYKPE